MVSLHVPDLGSQDMRVYYQDQVTDITQARLDGTFDFEDRTVPVRRRNARDGNVAERIGRVLSQWDWGVANPGELPDELLQPFCTWCQFEDFSIGDASRVGFKGDADGLANWAAQTCGFDPVASTDYREDHTIKEDTHAAYLQYGIKGEFAGRPVNTLLGVRYEQTDVTSISQMLLPTPIRWQDNNDFFTDREHGGDQLHPGSRLQPRAAEPRLRHRVRRKRSRRASPTARRSRVPSTTNCARPSTSAGSPGRPSTFASRAPTSRIRRWCRWSPTTST